MIVGIDEVGRGPWAGPLVMGAVVLGCEIEGLTDSKKLSKKRREELDIVIRSEAKAVGLGWVSALEIDTLGLAEALQLACRRALEQVDTLGVAYHEIIIDGTVNFLKNTSKADHVTTLKKADLLIPSVSAASIVAKVARDRFMESQDAIHPGYAFASHVGYGTAAHREAIERLGVTPLHRLSFAPLVKYQTLSRVEKPTEPITREPTTKVIGDAAEDAVAEYLKRKGHAIVERNWRTKACEIDIVSQLGETLYFTEVKYRKTASHGDGLSAITTTKQAQMKFAARVYVTKCNLHHMDLLLAVAAVSGEPPHIDEWFSLV